MQVHTGQIERKDETIPMGDLYGVILKTRKVEKVNLMIQQMNETDAVAKTEKRMLDSL